VLDHLHEHFPTQYRVFFFTGHMKNFRVWEITIILMDFEMVTSLSGYVQGPELNMKNKS